MSTRDQILHLKQRMGESIIGQEQVIERLLLTLLANGNLLLEGLPGLAKTRTVKSLARQPGVRVPAHPIYPGPTALRRHRH